MTELSKQDKEDLNTLQALYKMFAFGDVLVFVLGVPIVQLAGYMNADGGPDARVRLMLLFGFLAYGILWMLLHVRGFKLIQKRQGKPYITAVNILNLVCLTPVHTIISIWAMVLFHRASIQAAFGSQDEA